MSHHTVRMYLPILALCQMGLAVHLPIDRLIHDGDPLGYTNVGEWIFRLAYFTAGILILAWWATGKRIMRDTAAMFFFLTLFLRLVFAVSLWSIVDIIVYIQALATGLLAITMGPLRNDDI